MIRPALADDALLAGVRAADRRDGYFRLWWLGQSGFLTKPSFQKRLNLLQAQLRFTCPLMFDA